MTSGSQRQWTLRDEGFALRLRIRQSMVRSGLMPEPAGRLAFIIRGRGWNAFMTGLLGLGAFAALHGIWFGVGMLMPIPFLAWHEHRTSLARRDNLMRAERWRQIAFAIGMHMIHDDAVQAEIHNMHVGQATLANINGTIDEDEVARLLRIATLTTHRNRMLIGAYLQMRLLSRAEEIRSSMFDRPGGAGPTIEIMSANLHAMRHMPVIGLADEAETTDERSSAS